MTNRGPVAEQATRSAWGAHDSEFWTAPLAALGPRSPLQPLVLGQIARLDRELGTGA